MTLFYVAFLIVIAMALSALAVDIFTFIFRRRGAYPAEGRVTMDEVRQLVARGEHVLAMRAYREATGASLRQTREVIAAMEQASPPPKNDTEG